MGFLDAFKELLFGKEGLALEREVEGKAEDAKQNEESERKGTEMTEQPTAGGDHGQPAATTEAAATEAPHPIDAPALGSEVDFVGRAGHKHKGKVIAIKNGDASLFVVMCDGDQLLLQNTSIGIQLRQAVNFALTPDSWTIPPVEAAPAESTPADTTAAATETPATETQPETTAEASSTPEAAPEAAPAAAAPETTCEAAPAAPAEPLSFEIGKEIEFEGNKGYKFKGTILGLNRKDPKLCLVNSNGDILVIENRDGHAWRKQHVNHAISRDEWDCGEAEG